MLVLFASDAWANPASLVPSAGEAHTTIDYDYTIDSAQVTREDVGRVVDPTSGIPVGADLSFKQYRHTITPRIDLGVLRDTFLTFAIPIVITQARELSLADGVTRDTSSTVRDGILTADGFDARDPGTPLPPTDNLMFRGVNRHGLSHIDVGLAVAPMNQQRDPTKPTWKMGVELQLAVGKIMKFDAMRTSEETGVSTGVHELKLWSSFDRRFDRTEGYFELHYLVPLTARESSLFDDIEQTPGEFGATNTMPGQRAGASFGLEIYAIDDKANQNTVSFDLGARVEAHFEGREYSEMWEVFALAGDARLGGPLILDRDPTEADLQAFSHPGISNIENYLETAARLGVRAQLGKHVRIGALVDLAWKTDHAISFADAGVDLPTCTGGNAPECETEDNDLVNPGTREVNPLHSAPIDLVGHRYHSEDNFAFQIGVQAQALF